MIEVLEFAFQSFWHFVGCMILLTIAMTPLYTLAAVLGARAK